MATHHDGTRIASQTELEGHGIPERRKIKPGIIRPGDEIEVEAIKISGELTVNAFADTPQLHLKDRVTVTVHSADGTVLAFGEGMLEGGGEAIKRSGDHSWIQKTWRAVMSW